MWEINENSEMVEQIEGFSKKLFNYQLSTIKMMEDFESKNYNVIDKDITGILSNKVGSGKSLIILGLISRNVNKITVTGYQILNASLIVSPCNIVNQWVNEASLTNLKVLTLKTNKEVETLEIASIPNFDLVICSNSMYNNLCEKVNGYFWDRVVFDEADSVKAVNSFVYSRFFWIITNSLDGMYLSRKKTFINQMLKSLSFYWDYYQIGCNFAYINKELGDFNIHTYFLECTVPCFFNMLKHHLSPIISDLIRNNEIEKAVTTMGGNISTVEDLIKDFDEKTMISVSNIENQIIHVNLNSRAIISDIEKKVTDELENEIKSFKTRFESIKEKMSEIKTETCTVCLCEFENPIMLNCCTNIVCLECFRSALVEKNSCVFCRKDITPIDTTLIIPENSKPKIVSNIKSKTQTCIDLITACKNEKILLFADQNLSSIRNGLHASGIYHEVLPNGLKETERTLKRYRSTQMDVLFLSQKNIGAGINLENTTSIVICDPMTPFEEEQLIGKAIRASRNPELPLTIYHLYHKNEIN
jgi:SNF2 family DNA or RNA helicase